MFERPPKVLVYAIVVATTVALIPPVVIYMARELNSDKPRIHIFQDMDNQAKFKTQQVNELFRDNRANRPEVEGAVARGEARLDDHYWTGWVEGDWVTEMPDRLEVDRLLLERGQERFGIYCSMCHGVAGYGDGAVHHRAMELVNNPAIGNGTVWVQPRNLHEEQIRERPIGHIYNTITNGLGSMAGYEAQIPVEDRWAIAAYVRVLQRSQNARPEDLGDVDPTTLELRDLRPEVDGEDGGMDGGAQATASDEDAASEGASS